MIEYAIVGSYCLGLAVLQVWVTVQRLGYSSCYSLAASRWVTGWRLGYSSLGYFCGYDRVWGYSFIVGSYCLGLTVLQCELLSVD